MGLYWVNIDSGNAVKQQAITWANVDSDMYRHMTSLGHNELKNLCGFLHSWVGHRERNEIYVEIHRERFLYYSNAELWLFLCR